MDKINILDNRNIIKKDRYIKIGKPKKISVAPVDEELFKKASNAIDEVVKMFEDESLIREKENQEETIGMRR